MSLENVGAIQCSPVRYQIRGRIPWGISLSHREGQKRAGRAWPHCSSELDADLRSPGCAAPGRDIQRPESSQRWLHRSLFERRAIRAINQNAQPKFRRDGISLSARWTSFRSIFHKITILGCTGLVGWALNSTQRHTTLPQVCAVLRGRLRSCTRGRSL